MSKISIKNIAEAIYGGNAEPKAVVNFLNKKGLLSKSEEILKELENIENKEKGIIKMKVKSAVRVDDIKRKQIEDKIKIKYQAREIKSTYLEDKSLLGGMKLEVGEEVIDTTYRNKLNQLEKYLIQK